MFPVLVAAIALAAPPERTPDLVVEGTVARTAPAEPIALWDVARARSFEVFWPAGVDAEVCVAVKKVVEGDLFGDEVCFFRTSDLAVAMRDGAVGNEGTWRLFETPYGHRYYADEAPTPARPAVDELRKRITGGTPAEKAAAIRQVAELGLLQHVPDVIAAITDSGLVPEKGMTLGRPVGAHAVDALLAIATRLEGEKERPASMQFDPTAAVVEFDRRAVAVQGDWRAWWDEWKEEGPTRPAEGGETRADVFRKGD